MFRWVDLISIKKKKKHFHGLILFQLNFFLLKHIGTCVCLVFSILIFKFYLKAISNAEFSTFLKANTWHPVCSSNPEVMWISKEIQRESLLSKGILSSVEAYILLKWLAFWEPKIHLKVFLKQSFLHLCLICKYNLAWTSTSSPSWGLDVEERISIPKGSGKIKMVVIFCFAGSSKTIGLHSW